MSLKSCVKKNVWRLMGHNIQKNSWSISSQVLIGNLVEDGINVQERLENLINFPLGIIEKSILMVIISIYSIIVSPIWSLHQVDW